VQDKRKAAGFDVSDRISLRLLFDDPADGRAVASAFEVADVAGETLALDYAVQTRGEALLSSEPARADGGIEFEAVVERGVYANAGAFTVSVGRVGASS
jgi:isoleucyl-tRNA synthetase